MTIPGFTGEMSLDRRELLRLLNYATATHKLRGRGGEITPALSAETCRWLLKECVNGPNPRSYACDTWIVRC
jgi:hypothetical protein